jgi:homocysteine S-methyltransferase
VTHPLKERLATGALLADGAMGTMLYATGVPLDDCFDALNLNQPEIVSSVHRAYINAGADLIETNSFGANRFRLEQFGLDEKVSAINRRAVKLAREEREISGRPVLVIGSIGPTQRTMEPYGTVKAQEVRDVFREQIEALLEGGVDALSIETIGDVSESQGCQ